MTAALSTWPVNAYLDGNPLHDIPRDLSPSSVIKASRPRISMAGEMLTSSSGKFCSSKFVTVATLNECGE